VAVLLYSSPLYPANYPANLQCVWWLKVLYLINISIGNMQLFSVQKDVSLVIRVVSYNFRNFIFYIALQRQNAKNLKQIFPEKEYRGLSPNFHIHVSVSESYIPMMGLPVPLEEICRLILGIYEYTVNRSKTHECGNWG
jgi:hypothetical protein